MKTTSTDERSYHSIYEVRQAFFPRAQARKLSTQDGTSIPEYDTHIVEETLHRIRERFLRPAGKCGGPSGDGR